MNSTVAFFVNRLKSALSRVGNVLPKRHPVLKPAFSERRNPLQCASVIIPALNEAARIAEVVKYALADPATAEVIVVDDCSIDDTAELAKNAGAKVYRSSFLGKGASMKDAVTLSSSDFLVYLDGDLTDLHEGIITKLCAPLVNDEADFVKARFSRGGGRVTELTAKPMLKIFFPELANFSQPLGGIISARKSLLRQLSFEDGYGVDIGLLIDAHMAGARLSEVDVGSLRHDSQPLQDLSLMANEVSSVIYDRAHNVGRLHVEQILSMYEVQRHASAGIHYILSRKRDHHRLLLLDMDGTITSSRFIVELAKATGHEEELSLLLDNNDIDASTRSQSIAGVFRFVHKKTFENVARSLEIRPGVIEFVNKMRRKGFMVGVVSDSYYVAANIMRRRIFADFAIAHTLSFNRNVCTGDVHINPAFLFSGTDVKKSVCKSHVLRNILTDEMMPKITETWVIGDNINDYALMKLADRAYAIDPKSEMLKADQKIRVVSSFDEIQDDLSPEKEIMRAV